MRRSDDGTGPASTTMGFVALLLLVGAAACGGGGGGGDATDGGSFAAPRVWIAGQGVGGGVVGQSQTVVLRSDDGGASWDLVARLVAEDYVQMRFFDREVGWLVGGNRVARTRNGGETWESSLDAVTGLDFTPRLADVAFVDRARGVAVGTDPRYLSDGARADALSAPVPSPTPEVAHPAITSSPPAAWTGEAVLLGTRDGGRRLAPAEATVTDPRLLRNASLHSTCITPSGVGLATGTTTSNLRPVEPIVLLTEDGGVTWRDVADRLSASSRVDPLPICAGERTLWISYGVLGDPYCCRRALARSDDGGRSWTDLDAVVPVGLQLGFPDFVDPDVGWTLAGVEGVFARTALLRTNDGGRTWTEVRIPGGRPDGLQQIAFADTEHGVLVGSTFTLEPPPVRSFVFATTDGGTTWTEATLTDSLLRPLTVAIVP